MDGESQRIDKWLFYARVVKSRSLAARLAQSGRVRIDGKKCEHAAAPVRVGNVLTLTLERRILVLKVLSPGARRGPAPEARLLYEDLSPPQAGQGAPPDMPGPVREPGGRPTKKARRAFLRTARDAD